MTDFRERYADLGAFVHGKAPRRTAPLPPPPLPKVAHPTASMVIDGIQVEPAARLQALAAIRDRHRASARMATDRMHQIREQISERELRIRLLSQRIQPGIDLQAEGEIEVLRAEVEQLKAAQQAAQDETTEASEAAGAAQSVLRAALKFALDHGATIPLLLAGEVSK